MKWNKYLLVATVILANSVVTPLSVVAETNPATITSESNEEQSISSSKETISSQEVQDSEAVKDDTATEQTQEKEEATNTQESSLASENKVVEPEGSNQNSTTDKEVTTDRGAKRAKRSLINARRRVKIYDPKKIRLQDWKTTDKGDYVLIEKYIGNRQFITIPNEINGKPTKLADINNEVFPNLSEIVEFNVLPRADGTKVGLVDTNLSLAFGITFKLASIDLSGLDTSNVTNMNNMFLNVKASDIYLANFDTSNVTNMSSMFNNCTSLGTLDLSSFDTSNVTNMSSMFNNCKSLGTLDLSSFDTSNVTNMDYMFYNCKSLGTLDLSSFDTSNVTNMNNMFYECNFLREIDLSSFDTSNVTNMDYMFYNCKSLGTLDLSSFDTSNITNMNSMFNGCDSLKDIDLSSFDTSNVTNMDYMFYNCKSLGTLDLSSFDTSNITNMNSMFNGCDSLKDIDLSSFDTSNVTNMSNLFGTQFSKRKGCLVFANDSRLLNYNYAVDNTVALEKPQFDANGGQFSDNKTTKHYFTKVAYTPEEFEKINQLTEFNQFKEKNLPSKAGNNFLGWELVEGNDSDAKNVYPDLYNVKYKAIWRKNVNIPSPDDNQMTGVLSNYGISYMPKQFHLNPTDLNDSGPQSIPINKTERFDIGVSDLRNSTSQWTLKAQLFWKEGKELTGSSLKTTNVTGTVMKNVNDGTASFNPTTDLVNSNNEVQGMSNVKIPSTTQSAPLMTANRVAHNAVYNYNLGDVSLEIPETRKIQPGTYEGYVEWNLSDTL